MTLLFK